MNNRLNLKWARYILFAAAIYNVFWGAVISAWPGIMLFGHAPDAFIFILIRCIGMLVGVYGIAYYFCSRDPVRYWPLIFVGWIGKVLGPIGAAYYIFLGVLKPQFFIVNIFNDLVWLWPFGWIIYRAIQINLKTARNEIS